MGLLTDDEISEALRTRPEWRRDGDALVRDVELPDFAAALAYVNAVGAVAQERDHHPDLLLHGWNKVRVTISTHSEGGITDLDLGLADALPAAA
jgi:4a-hydroxytetrahydrobiopterin dehydratase